MPRLLALVVASALALALVSSAGSAPAADARRDQVPPREQWLADVKAVMAGSHAVVRARVAAQQPGERLAVNFDIDNTVLATYYDGGGAIPKLLKLARLLDQLGVAVVFNTGRRGERRRSTERQLLRNGFPVDALCLRNKKRTLTFSKQRCRNKFIAAGYTLIANVGNNETDFVGEGYERAYMLPNYDGALG